MPLSLIGALFLMLLMGFTINLLTLLAMVLAIGIVVDDAIIVLENVHRHIEEGMSPFDAAIKGARELAWPVGAMTTRAGRGVPAEPVSRAGLPACCSPSSPSPSPARCCCRA